ncbi:hypothetical protein LTR64_008567 [Lithohypha guttulata]|uniref:uncharacterized protein n=1 Tax=Lithohypha guttulata TaxID=1690604 RepID=UPI002DE13DF4|nr:hypothetical protein LTR51_001667 [Lithohypha guttulata]
MCGHNRRKAYATECGADNRRGYGTLSHSGDISAIVGALGKMKIKSTARPYHQAPTTTKAARSSSQKNGVLYATDVDSRQARAQQQNDLTSEQLPSYDEVVGSQNVPSSQTTPAVVALPSSKNESILTRLDEFRFDLEQYKTGARGGKWVVKRAAKGLAKELYYQEIEQRRGMKGYLQCGERKQVRRDLKPVKQMLNDAVWEARRERRGW